MYMHDFLFTTIACVEESEVKNIMFVYCLIDKEGMDIDQANFLLWSSMIVDPTSMLYV